MKNKSNNKRGFDKCRLSRISNGVKIDSKGIHYRDLNERIHRELENGRKEIVLDNVNGQRYIGSGLKSDVKIIINGTPGNDLAAFMDGPTVVVNGNAQDGVGNTMNSGKVIIRGDAGDIAGHSIRGGKIFVKGDVGYRVGIHMKSYKDLFPVIIAGGTSGDFLGEYMAGGLLIILGLGTKKGESPVGRYCGTGMHGGMMYIRGKVEDFQLGKEVKVFELDKKDIEKLKTYLKEYLEDLKLSLDLKRIVNGQFVKLVPYTSRPYGKLYAY